MPSMSELARVNLHGLDERYQEVTSKSKPADRIALIHAATLLNAKAHSFEAHRLGAQDGLVGKLRIKELVRELFGHEFRDDHAFDSFARGHVQTMVRDGLASCMESQEGAKQAMHHEAVWWVASDYERVTGHKPFESPAAAQAAPKPQPPKATPKKEAPVAEEKPKGTPGRKKGSRNRSRIETLSLAERTLKSLGRPVLLQEVYIEADFPVTPGAVRDVLNELVKEKRIYARLITSEDRAAIRSAGGPRNAGGAQTKIFAHASICPDREVGLATWGQPQDAPEVPVEAEEAEAEVAAPSVTTELQTSTLPPEVAAAELPQQTQPSADLELQAARQQIRVLEIKVQKLTEARDGLIAALETMRG